MKERKGKVVGGIPTSSFFLDPCLNINIVNGIIQLDFKTDGLTRVGIAKDLH